MQKKEENYPLFILDVYCLTALEKVKILQTLKTFKFTYQVYFLFFEILIVFHQKMFLLNTELPKMKMIYFLIKHCYLTNDNYERHHGQTR